MARKTGAVPSEKEAEEQNLDHAVLRSWFPRCVHGRAESRGHAKKAHNEGEAPSVRVDYARMRRELEKDVEKRTPTIVAKGSKTKTIPARVVPRREWRVMRWRQ